MDSPYITYLITYLKLLGVWLHDKYKGLSSFLYKKKFILDI